MYYLIGELRNCLYNLPKIFAATCTELENKEPISITYSCGSFKLKNINSDDKIRQWVIRCHKSHCAHLPLGYRNIVPHNDLGGESLYVIMSCPGTHPSLDSNFSYIFIRDLLVFSHSSTPKL